MALFVSNHPIWKHTPLQQRISAIDLGGKRLWTIGLEPCDSFIIESYDFDMIVFFVGEKEVDTVWDINPRKWVYVIVKDSILLLVSGRLKPSPVQTRTSRGTPICA